MYKNVIAALLTILETGNNTHLRNSKVMKPIVVYLNHGVLHSCEKE